MKTFLEDHTLAPWATYHPISVEDKAAMDELRVIVEPNRGRLQGPDACGPYDTIMERVTAPTGVAYEEDTIGGIPGWWCRPSDMRSDSALMHLHGGWFTFGSAKAFRHLVGHIAAHTGVAAFVPDYRLAPENPAPSAMEDVRASYLDLVDRGFSKIALTGDSAGGNLALGLAAYLATSERGSTRLAGVVAISPVTDLSLAGASWSSRMEHDPLFTRPQAEGLVRGYLGDRNVADPLVSPLYAELKGLAPVRVHVGNDEMLLDDSVRFAERAVAAGADAHLDVWEGMIHGFVGSIGRLSASSRALRLIGTFLSDRLESR